MDHAHVNGVELEYEVRGSGPAVLLLHGGLLADENTPLLNEPALTGSFQVVNYHRRGFAGSTHPDGKAQIADQVADARALLAELDIDKAHVVGHSLGGVIGIQLTLDHPEVVQSLVLLEPALMGAIAKSFAPPEVAEKSQQDFIDGMAKVDEIFQTGDRRGALMAFLETRAGGAFREVLDWLTTTGEFDQAVRDADTFLQVEMPAAYGWSFTEADAKAISVPLLSILGVHSPERAQKVHEILRQWAPQTQELKLENAEHALPLMDPPGIAAAIGGWLSEQQAASG
jgi:pimeloyl-ACP methyl ester carboxylesterase